jgi:hypothetical protein
MFWVGAMLYRGDQSSCQSAVSKYFSMTCFRRESLCRPHMFVRHYGRSVSCSGANTGQFSLAETARIPMCVRLLMTTSP